mmetsp:Transcript_41074/g.68243  ORF Transcript_41074/g.68243 Transcript_41074/m.68243 type:complete len:228 (-) Transcript_41074:938-1621(-)
MGGPLPGAIQHVAGVGAGPRHRRVRREHPARPHQWVHQSVRRTAVDVNKPVVSRRLLESGSQLCTVQHRLLSQLLADSHHVRLGAQACERCGGGQARGSQLQAGGAGGAGHGGHPELPRQGRGGQVRRARRQQDAARRAAARRHGGCRRRRRWRYEERVALAAGGAAAGGALGTDVRLRRAGSRVHRRRLPSRRGQPAHVGAVECEPRRLHARRASLPRRAACARRR